MITMKQNFLPGGASAPKQQPSAQDIQVLAERPLPAMGGGGNDDGFGKSPPRSSPIAPIESHNDGDIIYGARDIAAFIFAKDGHTERARKRVFNLAAHYKARNENAGFFKLKGALCLSKKQWRRFHGLS